MKMRMRMVITCHTPVKTPVTINVKLLKKCPKVQKKVKIFSTYRKMSKSSKKKSKNFQLFENCQTFKKMFKSSKKSQKFFNFSKNVKLLKKCQKVRKKSQKFFNFSKNVKLLKKR